MHNIILQHDKRYIANNGTKVYIQHKQIGNSSYHYCVGTYTQNNQTFTNTWASNGRKSNTKYSKTGESTCTDWDLVKEYA